MAYIDSTLMPGEHVVKRTQLHWIVFAPCAVAMFPASAFLTLAMMAPPTDEARVPLLGAGVLTVLIALFIAISAFIKFKTSEFAVTNKRVIIKVGFIARNSLEVLLTKAESIQVDQSVTGRMLGYGSIVVTGTGGSRDPYHQIDSPLEFRRAVQEQIAAAQE